MIVTKHKIVSIHYTIKDSAGLVLQQNTGYDPEDYLHGAQQLLPGLERAIEGMKLHETRQVMVAPEDGHGLIDKNLVSQLPVAWLEETDTINEGALVLLPDGSEAIVIEIKDGYVTVDADHPLAGQTLYYSISIAGIREATEAEISLGYPLQLTAACNGSPGCC